MSDSAIAQLLEIAIMVAAFVPAIVLHEVAHGYAAYKLGDPTAKNAGRLTLNPIAHIDLFGTIILPGCLIAMSVLGGGGGMLFGYAKPVPVNPHNFKDMRKGDLIVGLVGPLSNLALSLVGAAIAWGGLYFYQWSFTSTVSLLPSIAYYVWYFGVTFCMVNLCLAFFNLIPIPPLDGSSIISVFLSDRALRRYYQLQQYAMFFFLLVILVVPYFLHVNLFGWYLQLTAGNIADLILPI